MHDLNHDLARDVSGKFCLTTERSKTCQVSEKVRHFSSSHQDKYDDYNKLRNAKYLRTFLPIRKPYNGYKKLSNAKYLRTFFQLRKPRSGGNRLSNSTIRDLLPKFSCMRVLSLSNRFYVHELPDSICTMIHLRYLDLSRTYLTSLPSTICQLYNLQTLLLSSCKLLFELPTNLGELVNLRHLDISNNPMLKMPPQIGKLESLQTLSTFMVGEGNYPGLGELKALRQLKGSLSITRLENVKNVEDAIEANLKEKVGIEQLSFRWGRRTKVSNNRHSDILDRLQPCADLNHLTLNSFGGTRLSNWLGDGIFTKLTYIQIEGCAYYLSLPSFGQLPSLAELHFHSLESVRRVDSEFYRNGPSSSKPFQKLKILKFQYTREWEEWSSSGGGDNDDFPKLETLLIVNCPKLHGNLPELLPSLRDLEIAGCGELTAIIPRDATLRSLKLEGCKDVVFGDMTGLKSLISLETSDLKSIFFPNGMMENCNKLEVLRIRDWSSLTHFPDDGLPTTLKEVDIRNCNNFEFLPKETFHNYKHLSSLIIQGNSCDSMTSFPLGLFPNLKSLSLYNLKNLESFVVVEGGDLESLRSLQLLYIEGCDKLINFPDGGLLTPNLKELSISSCKNLKWLPEGMNTQLTSLQDFIIDNCEEVESFPADGLPSNLRTLRVMGCQKLMAKRRQWDLHTLTSLKSLSIEAAIKIETFPEAEWHLPTSITYLSIRELPNLKTIDATRLPPNLQTLEIVDCPLMAEQLRSQNTDLFPHLTIRSYSLRFFA